VNVPGRPSLRRNDQHDDAECKYRQSHELEYQRIKHGNSHSKSIDCEEAIDCLLISGGGRAAPGKSRIDG